MYQGLTISVQPVYNKNIITRGYIMTLSRKKFTHAIALYLSTHDNQVNLCSLATRHNYTLVVGNSNVKRSELDDVQLNLVSMVEDLAASYIALNSVHPVEAVELAYQEITARNDVPDNNNWLHYGTEDAWLYCTYSG